jgi:hypothetical protein
MSAPALLLGSVLTFATTDGQELQLTVSLTSPATASLAWGELTKSSSLTSTRHQFSGLPVPKDSAVDYRLFLGAEPAHAVRVEPIGTPDKLRIAVYGDSREGSEPHRVLLEHMAERNVDLMVHTGDVVAHAGDESGWVKHLSTSLPISSRRPLILALGNHEIAQLWGGKQVDGLKEAMEALPPPKDAIARELNAPSAVFHVRVGPALFISLDSNADLSPGSPQLAFLERVLKEKGDAKFVFVAYHHGPLSSGPHGGHRHGRAISSLLEKYQVTASLGGHDHIYERLVQNGVTYIVAGGGGAPLYARRRIVEGSRVFADVYNWTEIILDGDRASLEAFSLEGATIDKVQLVPLEDKGVAPSNPFVRRGLAIGAAILMLAAFVWVSRKL